MWNADHTTWMFICQYELWSPSRSRVAGLMLSRPTLLCISEIIPSRNSCSGGEMTRRQADESRGWAENSRRLQHEPATNSRDKNDSPFEYLDSWTSSLSFWHSETFINFLELINCFLYGSLACQIIYWAITSWNKTKMISRTRLSVFYPHYLSHLCEQ